MDSELLLGQLVELLGKIGIAFECRNLADEELNIKSGLCEVESQKMFIVDKRLSTRHQADLILEALKSENLDDVFVSPVIRELIERPGE